MACRHPCPTVRPKCGFSRARGPVPASAAPGRADVGRQDHRTVGAGLGRRGGLRQRSRGRGSNFDHFDRACAEAEAEGELDADAAEVVLEVRIVHFSADVGVGAEVDLATSANAPAANAVGIASARNDAAVGAVDEACLGAIADARVAAVDVEVAGVRHGERHTTTDKADPTRLGADFEVAGEIGRNAFVGEVDVEEGLLELGGRAIDRSFDADRDGVVDGEVITDAETVEDAGVIDLGGDAVGVGTVDLDALDIGASMDLDARAHHGLGSGRGGRKRHNRERGACKKFVHGKLPFIR